MADIKLDQPYPVAEAERGKFVRIDETSFTDTYPTSGRGKYAMLVYSVGSEESESGCSADVITNASLYENIVASAPSVPQTVEFGQVITFLEMYNNSDNIVYFKVSDETSTFASLSATGLILGAGDYYSLTHQISTVRLGFTASNQDIRLVGRYSS